LKKIGIKIIVCFFSVFLSGSVLGADVSVRTQGVPILSWNEVAEAEVYDIFRDTGFDFEKIHTASAISWSAQNQWTDSTGGVSCGEIISYRIEYRLLTESAGTLIGITNTVVPCAPQNLSAVVAENGISLNWGQPLTVIAGVTYDVFWADDPVSQIAFGSVLTLTNTAFNQFTDLQSLDGKSKYYGVCAVDSLGNSSMATTILEAVPAVPDNLTVSATGISGEVYLNWTTSQTFGVTAYAVYRNVTSAGALTITAASSITIGGAVDGAEHLYWVAAQAAGLGFGDVSSAVAETSWAPPQSPILTLGEINSQNDTVFFSWTSSLENGFPVGAYLLWADQGQGFSQVASFKSTTLSANVESMCGGLISYKVQAVDMRGNYGEDSNVVDVSYPCSPEIIFSSVTANAQTLTLQWQPSISNLPISRYKIEFSTSFYNGWIVENYVSDVQNSYISNVLTDYQSRQYRISAEDISGTVSEALSELKVNFEPDWEVTPRGLLSLSWSLENSNLISGYRIYYATFPFEQQDATIDYKDVVKIDDNEKQIEILNEADGINFGEIIWCRVASLGGQSVGEAVKLLSATAGLETPKFSSFKYLSGTTLNLSWNSVTSPARYFIYSSTDSLSGPQNLLAITETSAISITETSALTGAPWVYVVVENLNNGVRSSLTPSAENRAEVLNLPSPLLSLNYKDNLRVSLSWTDSLPESIYQVYRATQNYFVTSTAKEWITFEEWQTEGKAWNDKKPLNGTINSYYVLARKFLGNSDFFVESQISNQIEVIPGVNPGNPLALTLTPRVNLDDSADIILKWSEPLLGSSVISFYRIYYGENLNLLYKMAEIPEADERIWVFEGQNDGSRIYYAVEAVDRIGNSGLKTYNDILVEYPNLPNSFTVSSKTDLSVQIQWDTPGFTNYPIVGYALYRATAGSGFEKANFLTTTVANLWSDSPELIQNYNYDYYLKTINQAGFDSRQFLGPLTVSFTAASTVAVPPPPLQNVQAIP
jgi:fibronectin type 3 domain-containing protein